MKKQLSLIILLQLIALAVFAQQSDITGIVPSSAPAFTILGSSPTEISKPNNWNALQSQLTQNFSSNAKAVIPKDFAVEFSPYWLSDHPKFTYKDYLNSNGFSLRNLKISLATSQINYGKDTVQGMGFGFRIPIQLNGRAAEKTAKELTDFIAQKQAETTKWQSMFMSFMDYYNDHADDNQASKKTIGDFIAEVQTKLNAPPQQWWQDAAAPIKKMLTDTIKVGFLAKSDEQFTKNYPALEHSIQAYFSAHNKPIAAEITQKISDALKNASPWEISGAMSLVFPTSQFSYSKPGKLGFWSDYSFAFDGKGKLESTVALRYVHSWAVDTIGATDNGDLLGRLSYSLGSSEKFTLSAWMLLRRQLSDRKSIVVNNINYYSSNGTWDNKFGVDIGYKVSDKVAFAYSFGKGYGADPFSLPKLKNQLISFLSIYYSINTKIAKAGDDFVLKSL